MGKLIFSVLASLDGYVADRHGRFDWAKPDDEVHAFVNDLERPVGTYLYGRGMYDVMVAWEALDPAGKPVIREYQEIWKDADKIVFSKTLDSVSSTRTRLEREFDPGAVRELKTHSERDLSVGGPNLAAHAIRSGLVDEYRLLLAPVIVGEGKRMLPGDVRVDLELLDERRFRSGFVFLGYKTRDQR
jgi:dihydrofolate reductase